MNRQKPFLAVVTGRSRWLRVFQPATHSAPVAIRHIRRVNRGTLLPGGQVSATRPQSGREGKFRGAADHVFRASSDSFERPASPDDIVKLNVYLVAEVDQADGPRWARDPRR